MSALPRRLAVALGLATAVLIAPIAAFAHPLGNFTINLYGGIRLTPGHVAVDYVVDMAEIPTFQAMPQIDMDGDGTASDAERAAWAEREAPRLLANVSLTSGGEPVDLRVASSSMWFRPGQGGLRILRLETTFVGEAATKGTLSYLDRNFADRIGWREVTAVGANGEAISHSSVPSQSVSDRLLAYPQDLLSSPLHVTAATVVFHPGASAPLASRVQREGSAAGARPGVVGGSFAALVDRTGPLMVLAILLAVAFGALHALGPGHGKTLMAAYLVGAGGRARQAAVAGAAVAVMHTASVLALGLLVLTATSVFPAERVYPWLGLGSGLLALGLGAALLATRLSSSMGRRQPSGHSHNHPHDHHHHEHTPPPERVLSRKGLGALAVAGGILPSPTALVVLLASVAFHRVAYGVALIFAFSAGLAAALIAVGLLALRARDFVSRRLSSTAGRLVPVLSAAAIVLMGLVLTARGIGQV